MSINVFNPCAPFFDMDDKERFGIQGVRKGIVVEIFFTYLVYFTIISIGSVKKIYPPESNLSYFKTKYLFVEEYINQNHLICGSF